MFRMLNSKYEIHVPVSIYFCCSIYRKRVLQNKELRILMTQSTLKHSIKRFVVLQPCIVNFSFNENLYRLIFFEHQASFILPTVYSIRDQEK